MNRFGRAHARAAHDQLGLKNLPRFGLLSAKPREQSVHGERSDLINRLTNGRQRNARSSGQLDVVEADYRDVFGDADAVVEKRILESEGAEIVVDENSVGLYRKSRDALANRVAGTEVVPLTLERVLEKKFRIDRESVLRESSPISAPAQLARHAAELVSDETDPTSSCLDQMLRRQKSARLLVGANVMDV